MTGPCTLTVPGDLYRRLHAHLFPGDGDEHGAVIVAGVARSPHGIRLLARELFLAEDGVDFVPGQRGYRMLRAEFILGKILQCRDEQLCYLAVHNHGGTDHVGFSGDDLASHKRGYPALLDVARGNPVGALVLARRALAGDIWLTKTERVPLAEARVLGASLTRIFPAPPQHARAAEPTYDRQARVFGDVGQEILRRATVGVIGCGGAGSLLIEYLARLGVGRIITADPDRLVTSNVPRVVGSRLRDALPWLTDARRPGWLRRIGERLTTPKVRIAARLAHEANRHTSLDGIHGDFVDDIVARRFQECDYLFLAADTMQARLVFNTVVHQYLIPGVQVGAKVRVDRRTGAVIAAYSVVRPVTPDLGCLWCNGLITASGLQDEAATEGERAAQRYIDDPTVIAPSVITMNAVAAAHAADDFLYWITGLRAETASADYMRFLPRQRGVQFDEPRKDPICSECGHESGGRLAMGDAVPLPTRRSNTT